MLLIKVVIWEKFSFLIDTLAKLRKDRIEIEKNGSSTTLIISFGM